MRSRLIAILVLAGGMTGLWKCASAANWAEHYCRTWRVPNLQEQVTHWTSASSVSLQGEHPVIVDNIKNAPLYYAVSPGLEIALRYLSTTDLMALAAGRHELTDGCYAMVQDYEPAPTDGRRYEAHRKFVDVQFIAAGREQIGYVECPAARSVEPYSDTKDVEWFVGNGSFVRAETGTFVVLFPHDAHMPGVALDQSIPVRKVVVKVPVER